MKIVKLVFKFCYAVLKALKIRLLVLWLLVSAILALTGVFARTGMWLFWTGCGACLFVTLLAWIYSVRKKIKRKNLAREFPAEEAPSPEQPSPEPASPPVQPVQPERKEREEPVWYDVAGRRDYCFAEYSDRYELFYRGEHGLERVRVDYKNTQGGQNG